MVLSPGLGAHPSANRYLEEHLASHGYLVVRPNHRGSDWKAVAFKTPLGVFTKVEFARRVAQLERSLLGLLDGEIEEGAGVESIALAGHSYGALTSAVTCGLKAPQIEPSFASKISALIAISPYGDSFPSRRLGIDSQAYSELSVPTLFVSGTRDEMFTLGKGAHTHLEPFQHSVAPEKLHLMIKGARHGHFSEILGWVNGRTKLLLNSTTTAFLDAQLRSAKEAQSYLDSELSLALFRHQSWVFR